MTVGAPQGQEINGACWIIGRTLVTNDAQSACLLKIQTKSQLARELLTNVLDARITTTVGLLAIVLGV